MNVCRAPLSGTAEGTVMYSSDHPGVRRSCAFPLRTTCNARPTSWLQRRELAWLTPAVPSLACAVNNRCRVPRTRPGFLAELGDCWYRPPDSWRLRGPRR
jgi:hypothetical protein